MRALFTATEAEVSPVFQSGQPVLSRPAWSSRPELPVGEAAPDPVAAAIAQARAEGVAEGRASVAKDIDRTRATLESALAEVVGLREKVLAESEEDCVRLALLVAETLVVGSDPAREAFARTMLKQGLALMQQADSVTVRVNPSERAAIAALTTEAGPSTKVIDDASVPKGGMVLESQLGRLDATLKRALADIAKGLGLDVGESESAH
jgi:flagellar biosynthesis/type III secretory pathway protein FliH